MPTEFNQQIMLKLKKLSIIEEGTEKRKFFSALLIRLIFFHLQAALSLPYGISQKSHRNKNLYPVSATFKSLFYVSYNIFL